VPIINKEQLKKDMDLLFTGRDKELLHPNIIRKLITENGGHRPIDVIYPAREYKKLLKNYKHYMLSISGGDCHYHHCEDLKDSHILVEEINSDLLHNKNYKQKMIGIFLAKIESLVEILEIYKKEILSDDKSSISKEKIKMLDQEKEALVSIIEACNPEDLSNKNYITLKKELENVLSEAYNRIMRYVASLEALTKEATNKFYHHIKQLETMYVGKKDIFLLFIARMNLLKETVARFKLELFEIKKQLNKQEIKVSEIINEKLKFVNLLIESLSKTIEDYQNKDVSKENHYTLMLEFSSKFKSQLNKVKVLGNFNDTELSILKKYGAQIEDARIAIESHLMELNIGSDEILESGKVKLEDDKIEVAENKEYFKMG